MTWSENPAASLVFAAVDGADTYELTLTTNSPTQENLILKKNGTAIANVNLPSREFAKEMFSQVGPLI